jgi:hypothetical protein
MSFYWSGDAKANVVIKVKDAHGGFVSFKCGGRDYVCRQGDTVTVSVDIVNANERPTIKEALKRIKEELE